MSDISSNLGNNSHYQFLNYDLAQQIIDDRDERDPSFEKLPPVKKISAYLIAFVNDAIEEFHDDITLMETIFIADNVIQHLRNLRTLFRYHSEENRAHNIEFALHLTKCWHGILSYHQLASSKEMREEAYKKITKLVDLFNRYPTADEHALGHYLTNYAGENWLPFPFMGILDDLYEENLENKGKSNLALLMKLITNIIESFRFI